MSTPPDKKLNIWTLPALALWGVVPAILMVTAAALAGQGEAGIGFGFFALLATPVILYPWSLTVLTRSGYGPGKAAGLAVLLSVAMCVVNLILSIAGCSWLSTILPNGGRVFGVWLISA